jgi:FkbM family methyltransferase
MAQPEAWLQALAPTLELLDIEPRGLIHLGAHDGREVPTYRRAGIERILLVEPNIARIAGLQLIDDVEVLPFAIGSTPGRFKLYLPSFDAEASLLRPINGWEREVSVDVRRLDSLDLEGINLLVADVQGAEVDALSSGPLDGIELAIVEATKRARYTGGTTQAELDRFMRGAGFEVLSRHPHHAVSAIVDTYYCHR